MAVGVRYVHKQIDRAIEDTGFLDAGRQRGLRHRQPGRRPDRARVHQPDTSRCRRPSATTTRRVRVRQALSPTTGTSARSYLWSRLYGNYSGLSQSDENGRTSPNVGRGFDYPMMMFQDGGDAGLWSAGDGSSAPVQDAVHLPVRRSAPASALNQYVASGLPVSREIGIFPTSNYPVQYLGRGSDGRTPTYSQTDLFVQHTFKLGGTRACRSASTCSTCSTRTPRSASTRPTRRPTASSPNEALFYSRHADPRVADRQPEHRQGSAVPAWTTAFQAPILARFGVKFTF